MKKFIKLSVLAIVICVFCGACSSSGCSSDSGFETLTDIPEENLLVGGTKCCFPLSEDGASLNVLITGYGDINAEDVYVWNKYEKATGVDINWTMTSKKERSEKVYSVLTNVSNIDLILRCKISSDTLAQYGENGLILNLTKDDMLQKYAPNCWAYLSSHPDALASVMNPDGSIYALPQINSGSELRVSRKILINKTWLERVGMEIPTTTEEFYQLLKAFKEQDVNQNGDPNDEIPLCSQDWLSIQEAFYGAFGLGNRGLQSPSVDYDEAAGKPRFIASSDGYKSFLEYFNKLYSENLLDKYVFSMTIEQWLNNITNDRVGVYINTNLATLPADEVDNWVAVGEALESPNGDKLWSAVRANFHSTGAAIIPSVCKNPELVLRWLDFFWTDEGTLFYHMGIENETYIVNDDGSYDYMPYIYDEMKTEGKSFDDIVAKYSPYPGGSNPTVEIAPYFKGGEMADVPATAARSLFEYGPKEYWPSFTFTSEENERLNILKSDIDKYCDTARIDFITGVKPMSDWDNYTAQLKEFGESDLLAIYQTAINRYTELKAKYD